MYTDDTLKGSAEREQYKSSDFVRLDAPSSLRQIQHEGYDSSTLRNMNWQVVPSRS